MTSKYHNIEDIQILNHLNNKDPMRLFHINTASLPKYIGKLEYLIVQTKVGFDEIDISEPRIMRNKSPINSTVLKDYCYESWTTESSKVDTLLYISNEITYKPKRKLCIYKSFELESTFIYILNSKEANVIVGCIYRHLHMDSNKWNDYYINNLLHKLSKENIEYDFNIDS